MKLYTWSFVMKRPKTKSTVRLAVQADGMHEAVDILREQLPESDWVIHQVVIA